MSDALPELRGALQAIAETDWTANDEGGRTPGKCGQIALDALAATNNGAAQERANPPFRCPQLDFPGGPTWHCQYPMCEASCKPVAAPPNAQEVKRLADALQWYADEARAMAKNLLAKNDQALLASVNVLALDNGRRADAAVDALSNPREAV